MKKPFYILFFLIIILAASFAPYVRYGVGAEISKEDVTLIFPPIGYRLLAFQDDQTGKIGFCHNSGHLGVVIPAQYDDMYNSRFTLVPVKKNGLWGAVDLSLCYSHMSEQPVIPCRYRSMKVISNSVIEAVEQNGRTIRIDISK